MKAADPIEENNRDVEEARGRRGSRREYRERGARRPAKPERMEADEVEAELVRMGVLLPFLHQLRLEALDCEFGIYDAAAPILNPTGWMRNHTTVERNRDIVKVLLKAQTEIRKLFPDQFPPETAR